VSPNPAHGKSTIEWQSQKQSSAVVTLRNIYGAAITKLIWPLEKGVNIIEISFPEMPGIYFIELLDGQHKRIVKVLNQ
jgi:hypothetical protein